MFLYILKHVRFICYTFLFLVSISKTLSLSSHLFSSLVHCGCCFSLSEKCPYLELFWSAFLYIRTEYGKILCISPYSVRILENTDQNTSKYGYCLRSVPFRLLNSMIIFFSQKFVQHYSSEFIPSSLKTFDIPWNLSLKFITVEAVPISSTVRPTYISFGHLFQMIFFIDSLLFFVLPCKHFFNNS